MKKLLLALTLIGIFSVGVASSEQVPDTFYQKEGDHYVEYKAYDTGSGVIVQKTGYCALSSSGTMRYSCDYQD